jgi:hypothetical protein
MHTTTATRLTALCLAAALMLGAGAVMAEPKAPEEEFTDEDFAKSFLGKPYEGDLEIEGWRDFGGGLVLPPIYVHQYKREDGTSLVLTSKETAPSSYTVTDALIVSKPWKGYAISIACTQGDDFTLRFIGDARGPESREWWTEVRRAWEIELETGKITKTSTKGVRCTNPSW